MKTRAAQIVFLSATPSEEFARPRAELRQYGELIECENLESARDTIQAAPLPPELIVIAQSRPGQFSPAQLDALVRLAPLARFIHLLGSWCEGETRTGRPWPGAKRIFWYDWPGEAARNLACLSEGLASDWSSPATSLEEERWLPPASHPLQISSGGRLQHRVDASQANQVTTNQVTTEQRPARLVLVCTRRSSFGEALAIACCQEGYASVWLPPHAKAEAQGVGAIVWEGVQMRPGEEEELRRLARAFPQVPILACVDFPRLETVRRAIAAGAKTVLAKPLAVADLGWHLDRWLAPTNPASVSSEEAA